MSNFLSGIKKISLITLISVISGLTYASALTISPARIELNTDPGSSVSDSFLLINEQEGEQTFYTSVENFEAQGESGTPNFTQTKEGLATWVQVANQITLKKGERAKVPFTVSVPQGADVGGHFAAIFLSTVPPSTKAGEVAVGAKVGMLVLLRVNGELKEGGGLLSFNLKNNDWVVTQKPINFEYRFNNSGNDRVNPTGDIIIRNMFGMRSATVNANPSVGNILPGSTRRFDVAWGEEKSIDSSATFSDHVSYEWRNFALGMYSARMSLSYGIAGMTTSRVFFFVLPWHLLLVLVAITAILFFILKNLVKRYNRWIIAQAKLR